MLEQISAGRIGEAVAHEENPEVRQSLLATAVRDSFDTVAFVCGSPEMMDQTTELLAALGLDTDTIFRNY